MGASEDLIDHSRTTRQHAGETMKNGSNAPGLVSVALAERRVRMREIRWAAKEPNADAPPPAS